MALRPVLAAALSSGLLLAGAAALPPFAGPALAAEEQAARAIVGKPVQEAQALLRQRKYKEALAKLREADAAKDKTPYEVYVIAETRANADLGSEDYPAAITALEAVLTTGILPPADRLKRLLSIVEIEYRIKDYPALIDAANRYYKEGGTDGNPRLLTAQAYYVQNDFADATKTIRVLLAAEARSGKPPAEDLLLLLLSSEFKEKDEAGYRDTLERLVSSYPKTQYWADLLTAVQHQLGFANRLTLDLDRLELATGVMDAAGSYMDAAELALSQGLPGDATAILDGGYAAGILGKGAQAERQKRLMDMAQRQSADDKKTLPQLAAEAAAAATGLPWIKLGEADASYGRYDDAIAAFQQGLKKGGLDFPEDAKLHLGIALLKAGQTDKGRDVLAAVEGKDGVRDLARLWAIAGAGKPG